MTTDTELSMAFQKASNDLAGFTVAADFAPFRDMKVVWERTTDSAYFHVSDYLKEAPIEVIEGLAETIIRRMNGEEVSNYPDYVIEYLTSKECREKNVGTYITRSRTISDNRGTFKNLQDILKNLMEKGLVPDIEGLRLYWSKRPSMTTSGQTSKIMRVVIMNNIFDAKDVPDYVLEYCLLYQIGFVMSSIECMDWTRTIEYTTEFKNRYDRKEKAESWLKDRDLQL